MLGLIESIEQEYQPEHRQYLGFSQVGSCVRKAWFRTHRPDDAAPLSAASILTFEDGNLHEKDVVRRIRVAGHFVAQGMYDWSHGDPQYDPDEQFTLVSDDPAFEDNFLGHPDGIVEVRADDGPKYHLLEIKSKSMASWRYAHRNWIKAGAFDNYNQVMMSLHYRAQLGALLGVTIEPVALLIAKSKQDAREDDNDPNGILAEYEIEYDYGDAMAVIAFERMKYERLKVTDGDPPMPEYWDKSSTAKMLDPRTADNRGTNSALCRGRYCNFRGICLASPNV